MSVQPPLVSVSAVQFARRGLLRSVLVILVLVVLAAPVVAVLSFVGADTQGLWRHLAETVLAAYVANSVLLVIGVVAIAIVAGVGCAWLVTVYAFPLRGVLEFALVMPLAMPAYILAYAYTDLLQVTGPVQTALREATGWSVHDYWFPNIRSLGGAIFVLGAALTPYPYLIARAAFGEQSSRAVEVARALGLTPLGAFLRVAVPLARPAIAAAAALVAMETLADFGAVQFFGLETFTTGIYRTWFAYGNPSAAAQLAALLLAAVFLVLTLEQASRGDRRFAAPADASRTMRRKRLGPAQAIAAITCCLLPFLAGFLVPVAVLGSMALDAQHDLNALRLQDLAWNTAKLAIVGALVATLLAGTVTFATGRAANSSMRALARFAYLAYATPGVVVGVGLLIVAGTADSLARASGVATSVLAGSLAFLVYAYVVRFFFVAHGPIDAAFVKLGPRLGEAARTMGARPFAAFRRVELPLLRGTFLAAAALVFADVIKELPATMILRPFNFETLATEAFQLATTERLDQAALPSLAIAAAGLIPVTLLWLGIGGNRGHSVTVSPP